MGIKDDLGLELVAGSTIQGSRWIADQDPLLYGCLSNVYESTDTWKKGHILSFGYQYISLTAEVQHFCGCRSGVLPALTPEQLCFRYKISDSYWSRTKIFFHKSFLVFYYAAFLSKALTECYNHTSLLRVIQRNNNLHTLHCEGLIQKPLK